MALILCQLPVAAEQVKLETRPADKSPTAKPPVFSSAKDVVRYYGPTVRPRLRTIFAGCGVSYPPESMTWICLKQEKQLLLFAPDKTGRQRKVLTYPVIGLSGSAGPKLKEGDEQVPEGFYKITVLRPNLVAHIGMGINYPNQFDVTNARQAKRRNLGGDILIHGSQWSTGCLAMGNPAIEEMFVLVNDMGPQNIDLVFAPCDLTRHEPEIDYKVWPGWLPNLYKRLRQTMSKFPLN